MNKVLFKSSSLSFDWASQLPGRGSALNGNQFYIDEDLESADWLVVYEGFRDEFKINIDRKNTILITGEPESIKHYDPLFLKQFNYIVTANKSIKHKGVISSETCLPWLISFDVKRPHHNEFDFDFFASHQPLKKKMISVICSNKKMTRGHKARLDFVNKLKARYDSEIDFFGRGFNDFDRKYEVLAPYRFHIALENSIQSDYWTEKITDSYLVGTFPLYSGCPNIMNYFPESSLLKIDISSEKSTFQVLNKILDNKFVIDQDALNLSKTLVMEKYNVFYKITDIINSVPTGDEKSSCIFHPEIVRSENLFKKIIRKLT